MRIILKKPVKKIGNKGDVVVVKDGYAQNYLIPQGLGIAATAGALKDQKQSDKKEAKAKEKNTIKEEETAKRMAGRTVTLKAKASTEGTLFASIKARAIIEAAKKQTGIELSESKLNLPVIKKVGTFDATVAHGKANASFQIVVEPK